MTVDRNGAKRDRRNAKARAQLDAFAEDAELDEAINELSTTNSHMTLQTTETTETATPLVKK